MSDDVRETARLLLDQLRAGKLPTPPGYSGLDPNHPASLRIGQVIGTERRAAGLTRGPRRTRP